MQYGSASIVTTEAQAKNLTIGQLDAQIEILVWHYQNASRPQQRRDAFRLPVWLVRKVQRATARH